MNKKIGFSRKLITNTNSIIHDNPLTYYGVEPCTSGIPLAFFANKKDAELYAKEFTGLSKRSININTKDYTIVERPIYLRS